MSPHALSRTFAAPGSTDKFVRCQPRLYGFSNISRFLARR